jgi:hypothetical protein
MTFDDIANRVINNKELKTVLTNYVLYDTLNPTRNPALVPYENLIAFQVLEGEKPIEEYGYQVGEPWPGDIENANILFVSRTLAYESHEICPRYIPNESPDAYLITTTDKILKVIENGCQSEDLIETDDVIEFCNTRFKRASLSTGKKTLYIQTSDGIKAVGYWGAIRNNVESLLLPKLKSQLEEKYRGKMTEYIQKLMMHVACSCVVPFKVAPFKSKRYFDAFKNGGTFKHCWDTFAEDIISLSLCKPKIIVLVGDDILSAFQSSSKLPSLTPKHIEQSQADKRGNTNTIYLYEYEGSLIVNVGANQGNMRSFADYFTQNSQIFYELQKKFSEQFSALKTSTKNRQRSRR